MARDRVAYASRYAATTPYVSIPDVNGTMAPSGAAIRVSIKGDFYVGLGVCSHDENVIETAIFSNVRTEPLSPITGQPVLHSTLESVIVASTDRRVRSQNRTRPF